MAVLGVDGCRGGWLGALAADTVTWHWSAAVEDLLALPADVVAVDIPIGLPEAGPRECDRAARRLLGRRASVVFPAPVRAVLECRSYAEARAVLAARGDASMSAQAFGIVAAVRAVDDAVSAADDARVIEAHPELAFLRLTGQPLPSKHTADGLTARLEALTPVWPEVRSLVAAAPPPGAVDDALDALACAVTARRWLAGAAETLGDGARDARGLPMRIVM